MNLNNDVTIAVKILCNGGLVAFPTETVYGLGADAMNKKATNRIFEIKKRPKNHPLIVHVASVDMAKKIVDDWPQLADKLANKFWPGPMTLVFKKNNLLPECVTGGQNTVAIRIPSNHTALNLLKQFAKNGSGYVAAPSANIYGLLSNTRYWDVKRSIGNYLTTSDFILEGQNCSYGVESTIIDLSSGNLRILRPGGITRNDISDFLNIKIESFDLDDSALLVPGCSEKHYCPRTPLYVLSFLDQIKKIERFLNEYPKQGRFFYWGFRLIPLKSTQLKQVIAPSDPKEYGRNLYSKLNDLDEENYTSIFFESPPKNFEWEAVNNRLEKASS